ncbi:TPA: hypothetical protein NOE89_000879 [Pseudomonas aeruginosa]|nr:hypothetical protein [Pseudomonas aeruginosa]
MSIKTSSGELRRHRREGVQMQRWPADLDLVFLSYFALISCTANQCVLANLNAALAGFSGQLINLDDHICDGALLG